MAEADTSAVIKKLLENITDLTLRNAVLESAVEVYEARDAELAAQIASSAAEENGEE